MAANDVVASMRALLAGEPTQTDAFLMAAVYLRAIREDDTPRNITNALFKALPDADAWPALRDALLLILDE